REGCPRRRQSRAPYPRLGRDIAKFPIAQIAIENIGSVEAAKIKVNPTVPVEVARGRARAIEKDLIGEMTSRGENVRERNARGRARQRREPRLAPRRGRHRDGRAAV